MATPTVAPRVPAPEDPPGAPRRPRRYRRRRWPRRVLIAVNVVVATCLVLAAGGYAYVTWRFGQIGRVHIGSLLAPHRKGGLAGTVAAAGPPMNILVVGSDTRSFVKAGSADARAFGTAGTSPGQSDTIMLIHLDPAAKAASILSIPRDLWLPIAGTGHSQRINTAIEQSPDVLVRTIQDNFGIEVNHFVEVDFQTFRDVVNAIGGVKFWYPEPVRDSYSGLNITTPGCYGLDGNMALALVRARHMQYYDQGYWHYESESDLARIRRQQLFVKKVVHKAQSTGLFNVTAINGVVSGVVNNLTVDSGFSQSEMLRLAKLYKNFNPDTTPAFTMPNTAAVVGGADVLLPVPSQNQAVIAAWEGNAAPPSSSPTTAPYTAASPLAPADITVSVLNGSGRSGEATAAASQLKSLGFSAAIQGSGRANNFNYTSPVIRYGPQGLAAAQELQRDTIGGAELQSDPALSGTSLVFVTGATYSGFTATAAGASAAVAPSADAGSTTTTVPVPRTSSSQPAFPGTHGSDPPPAGSGC
ncbi:MAG TPA: LCP family protein [Acidimicrobiales bacterium]|nr:LCP family protein [Acidimicrobiales bacterium]